jgi:3-hydroxybutyrate dehydrogenase
MTLQNRIALITGGGRGIGRAIATVFARAGADLVLTARSIDQLQQVANDIKRAFSTNVVPLVCDVSEAASVEWLFKTAKETFKRGPDILVNNAGIAETAPLIKTDDELWHRHLAVNLSGTFYCMRSALPSMIENGWGRVINIASIAGKTGAQYIAAYSASKHGVLGLTRTAALEMATKGITVNAICPGYVETDMTSRGIDNITRMTGISAEQAKAALEQKSPQNRMVTAEEVAALALLLASDEGRGINGQAINVDGGSVMF